MELLEYAARQLHFYLSDFHYIEKLMAASDFLYMQIETYSLEEWTRAYEYIFQEEHHPQFQTTWEVYEKIYEQAKAKGTPFDRGNVNQKTSWKQKVTCMMGKRIER